MAPEGTLHVRGNGEGMGQPLDRAEWIMQCGVFLKKEKQTNPKHLPESRKQVAAGQESKWILQGR